MTKTLTAVTPAKPDLPGDLALLLAPVLLAGAAGAPEHYVGRAEGVLLDADGGVVAFAVRLSPALAPGSPRTLVAASAVSVTDDRVLILASTCDELLAQPRLAEDLEHLHGGHGDSSLASLPPPDPPRRQGGEADAKETATGGIEGTAIGAAAGALLGIATLTPIGVLALAAFFAVGGGLLGAVSGASKGRSSGRPARDDEHAGHHSPAILAPRRPAPGCDADGPGARAHHGVLPPHAALRRGVRESTSFTG